VNAPTGSSSSTGRPGYATPAASYPVRPRRHTSHMRLLVALSVTMIVVIAVSVLIAWLFTPPTPVLDCKFAGCGQPPTAPPVGTPPGGSVEPGAGSGGIVPQAENSDPQPQAGPGDPVQNYPRFNASDGSWSVSYPPGLHPDPDATEIGWHWTPNAPEGLRGATVSLFGRKAGAQTPQDIVQSLMEENFPGSQVDYQIPNAMVGFQPGYGEIRDYTPQSGTASYTRGRVFVIVAIKNGLALGMIGAGPYYKFDKNNMNHPSGANSLVALQTNMWLNSFMWKGDPPR
jgi:hypothetical protein